mgnify:FL=1
MQVPKIFKNKYVCYAVYALAVINILGYLGMKSYECLALFGLAAYSANCYCKDKVCAILAGLFVANFVFGCGRLKENFEGYKEKLAKITDEMLKKADNAEKCGALGSAAKWDEAAKACNRIQGFVEGMKEGKDDDDEEDVPDAPPKA